MNKYTCCMKGQEFTLPQLARTKANATWELNGLAELRLGVMTFALARDGQAHRQPLLTKPAESRGMTWGTGTGRASV